MEPHDGPSSQSSPIPVPPSEAPEATQSATQALPATEPESESPSGDRPFLHIEPLRQVELSPALRWVVRALAGIRNGIVGGVLILFWLLIGAYFSGDPLWLVPNLFASAFHGERALSAEFSFATLSGIAFHLLQCATLAVVFALVVPASASLRSSLSMGIGFSLLCQYAAQRVLWRYFSPWIAAFAPPFVLWTAALAFGICLAATPWSIRRFEREFSVA